LQTTIILKFDQTSKPPMYVLAEVLMPWAHSSQPPPFTVDYSSVWVVYDAANDQFHSKPIREKAEAEKSLDILVSPQKYPDEFIPDPHD
jgi:hypothetical protein